MFDELDRGLGQLLQAAGLVRGETASHPEAFGSRYSVYVGPHFSLRLTWDGKEGWFVLECDRLPGAASPGPWVDLSLQRYDPARGDERRVAELREDIHAAARSFIGQW